MPAILVTLVVFVLLSMGRGLPDRVDKGLPEDRVSVVHSETENVDYTDVIASHSLGLPTNGEAISMRERNTWMKRVIETKRQRSRF